MTIWEHQMPLALYGAIAQWLEKTDLVLYHCPSVSKTPAQNPDLNPIEHMWYYLQQKLYEHQISNQQDLGKNMVEEWTKIDRFFCKKLIQSMPNRLREDVQELWFQQDGATCHTARATIDLLKDTFGDRLISRFGPVNWPPRACDLTPLDYFMCGYVKSLVYADKPQTLDHLEDNIRRVIADIRPQMLEKVIENRTSRLDYIRASRGSPMSEIIFKM
ncbi:putative LOC100569746 [Trichonephila clavipes]|nr:putative LOC100569746 [Trichonephila clavipes]